jgi:hypothetical protein
MLASKLEKTFFLQPDATMRADDRLAIDRAVDAALDIDINNPQPGRPRASRCFFRLTAANVIGTTKTYVGNLTFQPLGIAHSGSIVAALTVTVES